MLLLHNKTTGEYLLFSDDYESIGVPTSGILRVDGYSPVDMINSESNDVDESEVSNNK